MNKFNSTESRDAGWEHEYVKILLNAKSIGLAFLKFSIFNLYLIYDYYVYMFAKNASCLLNRISMYP